MTETNQLDLEYVRAMGEDLRARLFPRPTKVRDEATGGLVDGPTPVALPALIDYDPYGDGEGYEILFVAERSVQRVNGEAPDLPLTQVRVYGPGETVSVDLEFGKLPEYPDDAPSDLVALLRALTGTL